MTYLPHSVLHPVTKTSRHQTTVKWRTQSPDFHEQFVYNSGSVDHLAKQSLHLTVWDREKGRPDEYIGEETHCTNLFVLSFNKNHLKVFTV